MWSGMVLIFGDKVIFIFNLTEAIEATTTGSEGCYWLKELDGANSLVPDYRQQENHEASSSMTTSKYSKEDQVQQDHLL